MVDRTDLEKIFQLHHENLSTEFKDWLDLSKSEDRANLAKAAIALANHGGGIIVLGLKEKNNLPPQSSERPKDLPHYSSDNVNASINRYANPHIHCEVTHVKHPISNNEHIFIIVPGDISVPVMCTRDLPGVIGSQRCYIRKPGPKSEEPFTAEEWRALITRCVQAGRDSMLEAFRVILQGETLSKASSSQIDILREFYEQSRKRWQERLSDLPPESPARFAHGHYEQSFRLENVEPAPGLAELMERMRKAGAVRLTGWGPFINLGRRPLSPVPAGDCIECWAVDPSEPADGRYSDFWRARPDGLFYQIRSFDEDFSGKATPGSALDYTLPIWRVGETILFIGRLAELFSEDAEITFYIRFHGLKDRTMRNLFDWRYATYDGVSFSNEIVVKGRANSSMIKNNLVEILVPLLRPLYEAFEFTELHPNMVAEEVKRLKGSRS